MVALGRVVKSASVTSIIDHANMSQIVISSNSGVVNRENGR
jgi:hypothetical protein